MVLSAEDRDALVRCIASEDSINKSILRRLKDDDPSLPTLQLVGEERDPANDNTAFMPVNAASMGLLGYLVGRCTNVKELVFPLSGLYNSAICAPFFAPLGSNRSIESIKCEMIHYPSFDLFRMLAPLFRGNPSLESLDADTFWMEEEQYRSLSSAVGESKSLKRVTIAMADNHDFGGIDGGYVPFPEERLVDIIEALKAHHRLEHLRLGDFFMGSVTCSALSDLLRLSNGVHTLDLRSNSIDDPGAEALVDGLLAQSRTLRELDLRQDADQHRRMTIRGLRALSGALSALLEDPNSLLQKLDLRGNEINNEIATILATALANNGSIKKLLFTTNEDSAGAVCDAFSKVLCGTTSINSTFLSNHTLEHLDHCVRRGNDWWQRFPLPDDMRSSLVANQGRDKKIVAVRKIRLRHADFNMQPLFEWDLKVLPFVLEWFEKTAAHEIECEAVNRKRKLAAIYQFTRGMPEMTIESITGAREILTNVAGKRPYAAACE